MKIGFNRWWILRFIDHETVSLQSTVSLGRVGRVLGGEIKLASRSGSKENMSRSTTPEMSLKTTPIAEAQTSIVSLSLVCEPDIVASAKASIQIDLPQASEDQMKPVAPPRRKRKPKVATASPCPSPSPTLPKSPLALTISQSSIASNTSNPPSFPCTLTSSHVLPSSLPCTLTSSSSKKTLHSFTKELEFSLDLSSATKGLYVIKPQVSHDFFLHQSLAI